MAGEEELLGRQAPHSLEAEQSVLGAMLIDSRCVADVIGLLKPEDFTSSKTGRFTRPSTPCSISPRSSTR